ncbi:MAG: R3H domain-containing nucleic acid-binding protein [Acidobacteriota bacterium]
MEQREFEGRNVDHAVYQAAQGLGVEPEQIEFEILEREPGRVRIRAEVMVEAAERAKSPAPAADSAPRADARSASPPPRRAAVSGRRSEARPRPRRTDSGEAAPWEGKALYPDLKTLVETLIASTGLDLSVQINSEADCERLSVEGPDAERLSSGKGEGLSALEHLLNKMVLRGLGKRVRIRTDSHGYRERREEEIVQMALSSAEKVKQEGIELCTAPLNPYERRLVHLALKEDPALITESEGDGFLKKITIRLDPSVGGEP